MFIYGNGLTRVSLWLCSNRLFVCFDCVSTLNACWWRWCVYMCVCICSAELHFSAVTNSDFDKRFRCKIKNPYTVVHVISSTDSIVRLDTNLPAGIIYLQLLKLY